MRFPWEVLREEPPQAPLSMEPVAWTSQPMVERLLSRQSRPDDSSANTRRQCRLPPRWRTRSGRESAPTFEEKFPIAQGPCASARQEAALHWELSREADRLRSLEDPSWWG